jgi:hypothetical protein
MLTFGHNSESLADKGVLPSQTRNFALKVAFSGPFWGQHIAYLASEAIYDRISGGASFTLGEKHGIMGTTITRSEE